MRKTAPAVAGFEDRGRGHSPGSVGASGSWKRPENMPGVLFSRVSRRKAALSTP